MLDYKRVCSTASFHTHCLCTKTSETHETLNNDSEYEKQKRKTTNEYNNETPNEQEIEKTKLESKLRSKMGSKNGVQNGVQHGVQNGVQKWGPKWVSRHHNEQPPPTKMKNHRVPFHLGQVNGPTLSPPPAVFWPVGGGIRAPDSGSRPLFSRTPFRGPIWDRFGPDLESILG